MSATVRILKGYDLHCHFRRPVIPVAVRLTAECFAGAVAMGNTDPPIADAWGGMIYKQEILKALPEGHSRNSFRPVMTTMLTPRTTPQTVIEAARHRIGIVKYIPQGVSTNSEQSVALEKLHKYYPVLRTMEKEDMVFSGHWESLRDSKGCELEELDREEAAIPDLDKVVKTFPRLRIVVEHATTKKMISYVRQAPLNVRATLTMQHAFLIFASVCYESGIVYAPHNYCKPIAKTEEDRQAVVKAMISGDPHFFFGSDMAPHLRTAKEKKPPAAGVFCPGKVSTPLMVELFQANNAMGKINGFRSEFGRAFYGLPKTGTLELVESSWIVPPDYDGIVPFMAGQNLRLKVAE